MAKSDTTETEKKTTDQAGESHDQAHTVTLTKPQPRWPLITVAVFAAVVTLALIVVSWTLIASHHQTRSGLTGRMGQTEGGTYRQGARANGPGMRNRGGAERAAANGVVTAIDGDTITVAGQGKTVTVKKTSSTTVTGDKTDVAVNDSVIVEGTTGSDGTVTATTIRVRNQSFSGAASEQPADTPPNA